MFQASSELEVISNGNPRKGLKAERSYIPLKVSITLKGKSHILNNPNFSSLSLAE